MKPTERDVVGREHDELSFYEYDLLTNKPDKLTGMVLGSLLARKDRLRPADRELLDHVVRARQAENDTREEMTDAEKKAARDRMAKGAERAEKHKPPKRDPYSFLKGDPS